MKWKALHSSGEASVNKHPGHEFAGSSSTSWFAITHLSSQSRPEALLVFVVIAN